MQNLLKKFFVSIALVFSLGVAPSHAALLGDLTDGAVHNGSQTGMWSLFLNAGDSVYIEALRLTAFDPIMALYDGPNGTGSQVAYDDDSIPGNSGIGGGFSDPAFTYTALLSGEYTVFVSQFGRGLVEGLDLAYSVQATGSTATVPLPGTLALVGLGLVGLGFSRRKQA